MKLKDLAQQFQLGISTAFSILKRFKTQNTCIGPKTPGKTSWNHQGHGSEHPESVERGSQKDFNGNPDGLFRDVEWPVGLEESGMEAQNKIMKKTITLEECWSLFGTINKKVEQLNNRLKNGMLCTVELEIHEIEATKDMLRLFGLLSRIGEQYKLLMDRFVMRTNTSHSHLDCLGLFMEAHNSLHEMIQKQREGLFVFHTTEKKVKLHIENKKKALTEKLAAENMHQAELVPSSVPDDAVVSPLFRSTLNGIFQTRNKLSAAPICRNGSQYKREAMKRSSPKMKTIRTIGDECEIQIRAKFGQTEQVQDIEIAVTHTTEGMEAKLENALFADGTDDEAKAAQLKRLIEQNNAVNRLLQAEYDKLLSSCKSFPTKIECAVQNSESSEITLTTDEIE
ncbi:unnamed protein product [Caenorhabditis sp. 36 PRJEB53466]|nr:unnamed protein product [Caenorhabditis sp. 36 PRJEB53466]